LKDLFAKDKLKTSSHDGKRDSSPVTGLSPKQQKRLALPAMLAILALMCALLLYGATSPDNPAVEDMILYTIGISGGLYVFTLFYIILPNISRLESWRWIIAGFNGVLLGSLTGMLTGDLVFIVYLFIILTAAVTSITVGRRPALLFVVLYTIIIIAISAQGNKTVLDWLKALGPPAIAIVINETVLRLLDIMHRHIQRQEAVNRFARQIVFSLDTEPVLSLLNAAIQNALEADTYFVGLVEGENIKIDLIYDDGEYFSTVKIPIEGTLSGWVIKNKRSLFIPDLRHLAPLEGVGTVIIGKDKDSLSWVGVPMQTSRVIGVIALASYRKSAFEPSTLELLENLAQLAAMALDNTYRHAEVEHQSHVDSLTQVFNHGYFLKLLQEKTEEAELLQTSLGLIMLDIDYFKQYNDNYGHLFGDKVLQILSQTIRHYVKGTDAVGRWGGEEFAIALFQADGIQTLSVAERIRETMKNLVLDDAERGKVPAPTVSQGIAIFPQEADEMYRLIDIADKRLYFAKARGRDQIEPGLEYWKQFKSYLDEAT
jgi:diguanylate cyclase (GGDEF)-like protein